MSKDFKDDIQLNESKVGYIGIDYKKLRVGIIGGGKVGFLKAKKFTENNSYLEILSKDFIEEFKKLKNQKIKLLKKEYSKEFILDKHLIIIAINDDNLRLKIIEDCNSLYKIFVDCTESKNSLAIIPYQNKTNNFTFAIASKNANPKMSVLMGSKILRILNEYDKFEAFTYKIRCEVKNKTFKKEVLDFVITDEFKEIWEKGKAYIVLKMFFDYFR